MLKIKIVSDGTNSGTKVVDATTGVVLGGIQCLSWKIDVNMLHAEAVIRMVDVPVDIIADAAVEQASAKAVD